MSLLGADFDDFFSDAIEALRPYLDDIVCIGGCANALYRFHDHASNVMWGYLGTKDRDLGQLRGESFDITEEIVYRSVAKMLDAMLG